MKDFENDNNLFWNNGQALKDNGSISINEPNQVNADPQFVNAKSPSIAASEMKLTTIEKIKEGFKLKSGSPALDQGRASVTGAPLFDATVDFLGGSRPYGGKVDIGPHEYGSNPVSSSKETTRVSRIRGELKITPAAGGLVKIILPKNLNLKSAQIFTINGKKMTSISKMR